MTSKRAVKNNKEKERKIQMYSSVKYIVSDLQTNAMQSICVEQTPFGNALVYVEYRVSTLYRMP